MMISINAGIEINSDVKGLIKIMIMNMKDLGIKLMLIKIGFSSIMNHFNYNTFLL